MGIEIVKKTSGKYLVLQPWKLIMASGTYFMRSTSHWQFNELPAMM